MDFQEAVSKAQDAITVTRVYGEPYERDGAVLIPAAAIRGGGGGGGGRMRPEAVQEAAAASASAPARWART